MHKLYPWNTFVFIPIIYFQSSSPTNPTMYRIHVIFLVNHATVSATIYLHHWQFKHNYLLLCITKTDCHHKASFITMQNPSYKLSRMQKYVFRFVIRPIIDICVIVLQLWDNGLFAAHSISQTELHIMLQPSNVSDHFKTVKTFDQSNIDDLTIKPQDLRILIFLKIKYTISTGKGKGRSQYPTQGRVQVGFFSWKMQINHTRSPNISRGQPPIDICAQ